jgi:hypothetical protein
MGTRLIKDKDFKAIINWKSFDSTKCEQERAHRA